MVFLLPRERRRRHFRAHLSAAPLKRRRFGCIGGRSLLFPRSFERGPIEAKKPLVCVSWRSSYFRAHLSAAPLKLLHSLHFAPLYLEFPRSFERGPIEASTALGRPHPVLVISALIWLFGYLRWRLWSVCSRDRESAAWRTIRAPLRNKQGIPEIAALESPCCSRPAESTHAALVNGK